MENKILKFLIVSLLCLLLMPQISFAEDETAEVAAEADEDMQQAYEDVIEFYREAPMSLIDPYKNTFQIKVEKNSYLPSKEVVKGIDELGRINIYDQKSYRKYDKGVSDKTIVLDENTEVIIGSHNLYSAVGPSVNFIKRESSYGEYGATFITKNKYLNLAGAVYNSSLSTGNSGGVIISGAPVKLPVGELIIGSAVYSTNLGIKEAAQYGIFNQFRYKKFKFNTQLSKYKPNSSLDLDSNTLFLSPEIDLTESLSISTGLQNDMSNKKSRNDLTLKYHPKKSGRNLELEVTLTNFTRPDNAQSQQRFYLGTKFKI